MTKPAFTLVELLVAITLISILAGVGVTGYRQSSRRNAVEAGQGQIIEILRQAQSNTQSGKKIGCNTALDGWQVRFTTVSATLEEVCGVNTYVANTITLPPNIALAGLPTPNPILYKVLHQGTNLTTPSLTLTVGGFSITKVIMVNANGSIN